MAAGARADLTSADLEPAGPTADLQDGFDASNGLRDVLTHVPSQDFVDEGLIPDSASTCFLAELIEHTRIDANRDQAARLITERRPTDALHGLQLLRG